MIFPGQTLRATASMSGTVTGPGSNAPTAKLLCNGVWDDTVTVTIVAGADGNEWFFSAIVPATYLPGYTVEFSITATVASVEQSFALAREIVQQGVVLDYGSVTSGASASGFASNSTTLTATTSGAYNGCRFLFQTTASLGRVPKNVVSHVVSGSSPLLHTFTIANADGTTSIVGPSVGDKFIQG